MRLAIISDIHANLPALKAVLRDIRKKGVDDTYCLGDLVNFAGWDNEVICLIRENGISCIQGNHDERIGYNIQEFQFHSKDKHEREFGILSLKKVHETITPENRAYLKSLPFSITIQFKFPFHHFKICMVHSSPIGNDDNIMPDAPDAFFTELTEEAEADILLMGHSHTPFHRSVFCEETNEKKYRHFINPGSVGKSLPKGNKACYAILQINEANKFHEAELVSVEFHHVPYDAKKVIQHIQDIGLPGYYDNYLRGK